MRKHIFSIKQLEVSKNLILEKTTHSLRIALSLLDNTIEILMYRYIDLEITHRFKSRIKKAPYSFPDKVKLLMKDTVIESEIGNFIYFAHRYRNKTFHQDDIRKETLESLVLVLFEIACELFQTLELHMYEGLSDNDKDFLEYKKKFKLPTPFKLKKDSFINVVKKIQGELSISTKELKDYLTNHITNRIEDLERDISFLVVENKNLTFSEIDKNPIIKYAYEINDDKITEKLVNRVDTLSKSKSKLQTFNTFMLLEKEIETIENKLDPEIANIASYLDSMFEAWKESNYDQLE